MAIDWDEIGRRFDPIVALRPDEIPRIYVRRPDPVSAALIEELRPALPPRLCFLVGQRSSGKTAELLRAMMVPATRVRLRGEAGRCVVKVRLTRGDPGITVGASG